MAILSALVLKGISSIVIQAIVIRELLVLFSGNEFTLGIILGNWILLEAIGSTILRKVEIRNRRKFYAYLQIILSLALPFIIFFIRNCRIIFSKTPGESFNIWQIFIISFISLIIYCLADGALFFLGSRILSKKNSKIYGVNNAYILESIGFIIGAVLLSILLSKGALTLNIISIVAALNLLNSIVVLNWRNKNYLLPLLNSLLIILIIWFNLSDKQNLIKNWEKISQRNIFQGFDILENKNSLYSNIVVGKRQGQYNIFLNGNTFSTAPFSNQQFIEDNVHFTLSTHPNPKKALLIGNPVGIVSECLKYNLERLDYLEVDGALLEILKKYSSPYFNDELMDKRLRIINHEPRNYLANNHDKYDVILVNYPEPNTIQLNRFFTKEFFYLTAKNLNENGILSLSLPGSESFYSLELKNLNANIINTLKKVFLNIKVIPASYNIILSSNTKINALPDRISDTLLSKQIKTILMTPEYIKIRLNPLQENWYWQSIDNNSNQDINSDLMPKALFYSLSLWNAKFNPKIETIYRLTQKINIKILLISIFLLLSATLVFKNKKYFCLNYVAGTSGFSAILTNLMLIISMQAYLGFLYSKFVILSGSFMLGLSLGALAFSRIKQRENDTGLLSFLEILIISFTTLGILILNTPSVISEWLFYVLSVIFGVIFGMEFAALNNIYLKDRSAQHITDIYKWDLLGSFFGALYSGTILMPLLGTNKAFLIIILLKLFGIIIIYKHPRTN